MSRSEASELRERTAAAKELCARHAAASRRGSLDRDAARRAVEHARSELDRVERAASETEAMADELRERSARADSLLAARQALLEAVEAAERVAQLEAEIERARDTHAGELAIARLTADLEAAQRDTVSTKRMTELRAAEASASAALDEP